MATIGTLAVNIVARTEKFTKGLLKSRQALNRFGKIALGAGAGIAAGLVRSQNEIERSMNASLAIMTGVSGKMRDEMTRAANEVSRETRFSTAEAAKGYFFLASAGLDAQQSLASMPIVARFAAAGNFDLALATDLATDAQSALGMTTKDSVKNMANLTRVTDTLIKANTLANASAQQFSEALTNKAGAALRLVNKDVEEGLAVLAAYADQGIKGAEAGTALGIVMRDLQTKAIKNAGAFKAAGIEVFNMAGNMNRLPDIIQDIEQKLEGMSDAQKKATLLQVGFSDKSVAYIQTLLGTSEKIRGYEAALREAGGTAQSVADKQMTALDKATAKLQASWESLAISAGPVITDVLTKVSGLMDSLSGSTASAAGSTNRITASYAKLLDVLHTVNIGFKGLKSVVTSMIADSLRSFARFYDFVVKQVNRLPGINVNESLGSDIVGGLDRLATQQAEEFRKALIDKTPSERMALLARKAAEAADQMQRASGAATELKSSIAGGSGEDGSGLARVIEQAFQRPNRILFKGSREAALATRGHRQADNQKKIVNNTATTNKKLDTVVAELKKGRQKIPVAGLNG